ncbi:hypothetical protein [Dehalococcoides mccartyi]|uniref:Uncharacterized protein n=1 Tax=Dehalococcoides mccartyi (strain CBDB1) TaxID=255470 RepID=A0A916KM92_DEHMC|nr:hypothetical protein [Dehalococcoides mccartyi]CAI82862.1 hypothetical protein cbdbA699 [Dehalococcoides mccartyi CBDB1]
MKKGTQTALIVGGVALGAYVLMPKETKTQLIDGLTGGASGQEYAWSGLVEGLFKTIDGLTAPITNIITGNGDNKGGSDVSLEEWQSALREAFGVQNPIDNILPNWTDNLTNPASYMAAGGQYARVAGAQLGAELLIGKSARLFPIPARNEAHAVGKVTSSVIENFSNKAGLRVETTLAKRLGISTAETAIKAGASATIKTGGRVMQTTAGTFLRKSIPGLTKGLTKAGIKGAIPKIAGKAVSRFIPGVGWVLLGGDIAADFLRVLGLDMPEWLGISSIAGAFTGDNPLEAWISKGSGKVSAAEMTVTQRYNMGTTGQTVTQRYNAPYLLPGSKDEYASAPTGWGHEVTLDYVPPPPGQMVFIDAKPTGHGHEVFTV